MELIKNRYKYLFIFFIKKIEKFLRRLFMKKIFIKFFMGLLMFTIFMNTIYPNETSNRPVLAIAELASIDVNENIAATVRETITTYIVKADK
jgi:hypothetical protein